jgi:hypothetical protein
VSRAARQHVQPAPPVAHPIARNFRVENDKLAEHWDIVFAKPGTLPHSNGLF